MQSTANMSSVSTKSTQSELKDTAKSGTFKGLPTQSVEVNKIVGNFIGVIDDIMLPIRNNQQQDEFSNNFYRLCKDTDQTRAVAELKKIFENANYRQCCLWLNQRIKVDLTDIEIKILQNRTPLLLAATYGNMEMFKLIIEYSKPKNMLYKVQDSLLGLNLNINKDIKTSFKIAIKTNNIEMAEYIYNNFNKVLTAEFTLFSCMLEKLIKDVTEPETFYFLYKKGIEVADDSFSKIEAIHVAIAMASKEWEDKGNQKMIDYIKGFHAAKRLAPLTDLLKEYR